MASADELREAARVLDAQGTASAAALARALRAQAEHAAPEGGDAPVTRAHLLGAAHTLEQSGAPDAYAEAQRLKLAAQYRPAEGPVAEQRIARIEALKAEVLAKEAAGDFAAAGRAKSEWLDLLR